MTDTTLSDTAGPEDFLALVNDHRAILLKVARTYCAEPADREDLIQEMIGQLWRSYPSFDGRAAFTTWMYRVALNVAISHLRATSRRERHLAPPGALALDNVPAATAEPDERLAVLDAFMAEIDPMHRALLLLYLDERSHREIAEVLGITTTNVATRINRLKQRLRDYSARLPGGLHGSR
jgi:RNA polymerase sigma-70 factor (ECF subfamily)